MHSEQGLLNYIKGVTKSVRVHMSVCYDSGLSSAMSFDSFGLYMNVSRNRATSCEHQYAVCDVTADQ